MTRFRPCIDLHRGQVKQIVGSSLSDNDSGLQTNFVAQHDSAWYAELFKKDRLPGGHVIQLGPGNEAAAKAALAAWRGGLQIGGGIGPHNAASWIEAGASHVIVTSCLFDSAGVLLEQVLCELVEQVGKDRIVLDLSCRNTPHGRVIAMNRWQQLTRLQLTHATLDRLARYCAEFLIHAVDVEGLCRGIDADLVRLLGEWRQCPITYAGGISSMQDIELIDRLGGGHIDVTVGSALDLFGGTAIRYADLVARQHGALS